MPALKRKFATATPFWTVMTARRPRYAAHVDGRQRRFLLMLTLLSLACVSLQAVTGITDLVLYLTPLFLIAALLLSGHYVAEERIVAAWRGRRAPRVRALTVRPPRRRELPLASLLARSPRSLRGPPALLA
jgi:hypothetical protein